MSTLLPHSEQPVLRLVPMPADTNAHGTIFGGWVMSQVDIAGSIPAWRRAQGPVVTVAVNSFVFKEPVFVGDLVSFYARICKVGRTSVTVDVEVYAQRGRTESREAVKVTEAQLTYVAVDERRQPRPVPPPPNDVISV
jgi:acyl-CoA thioesterase YciA